MPADYSQPELSTAYASFLSIIKERDVDAITLCLSNPTNIPTGAMKWNRASNKFQEYSGSVWNDSVLSLAGGGTGANSAGTARTALGLGTLAVQDSNAVAITGGTLAGVTADASIITAGLIAQARLGTGSGGAGLKVLFDDQTYKDAEAVGTGKLWFTNSPPSGYLICDGSAISRTTYASLFAIIGTIWGTGDGSTTFNLPDFRQRFPLGKAASGTGNALAGTGGNIDHTHTGPSHSHTVDAHTHTGPSHRHLTRAPGVWVGNQSSNANALIDDVEQPDTNGDTNTIKYFQASTQYTEYEGTGATGSASPGTNASGTGATGTGNPPYIVVNFIIKY